MVENNLGLSFLTHVALAMIFKMFMLGIGTLTPSLVEDFSRFYNLYNNNNNNNNNNNFAFFNLKPGPPIVHS